MTSLDEIRATHLELSAADWRFRELAMSEPRYLKRESFRVFDQPEALLMFRVQSWPTFLRREKVAEFARISVAVSSLIRSIPRRVFRNDIAAIDRFYGVNNPLMTELLLDTPNGIDMALSRGDFIYAKDGFRCIEFNLVPSLGGWETRILAGMHLANPATAAALEELGLEVSFTDTSTILLEHVCTEIERLGVCGERNIAFTVDLSGEGRRRAEALRRHMQEELSTLLAGSGMRGRVFCCRASDLAVDRSMILRLDGERVHAVVEIDTRPTDQRVFRAFKFGTVALFNGPLWHMLSDKRNLALLSDESLSTDLTAEERSVLRQHVPWTRVVRAEKTTFEGAEVFLPDFVKSERGRLVLKNAQLYGGKEVFVGAETSEDVWENVLNTALQGNWVAQEYIPSRPLLYQFGDEGFAPYNVVWGPFVFGQRYGGAILRIQPSEDAAVINLSQTAAEAMIFEVNEDGAESLLET